MWTSSRMTRLQTARKRQQPATQGQGSSSTKGNRKSQAATLAQQEKPTRAAVKRKKHVISSSSSSDEDTTQDSTPEVETQNRSLIPAKDPTVDEAEPGKITQPISTIVHETLQNAWAINKNAHLAYLFDVVSPVRQFKRGMPFTEEGEFPEYSEGTAGDVTETDDDPPGWMPYMPREY